MSFDALQERIRTLKSPVAARLDLWTELPPALLARKNTACGGKSLQSAAAAVEEFGRGLIDALRDVVPAVQFPTAGFETLGWRGMEVLEKLIALGKSFGLFVIVDGQRGGLPPAAGEYASAWLGRTQVEDTQCPVFDADCATLNGYLGSDCLKPFLDACRQWDKCAFVLVKTPNPSSVELEDMVSGDRLVSTVMGDLACRLGRGTASPKYGFTALGVVAGTPYPAEMKQLRRRLEHVFFLVPGWDGPDMDSARAAEYAFDEYGRGAAVSVARPIAGAWRQTGRNGEDFAQAARAAAEELRRQWKARVTFL